MEKDWSNLAENFDDLQKLVTGEFADKIIKSELSKLEDLGDLLEFGCGSGNYTKSLSKNSKSILSTDISTKMVEVATKKLKDFENIKVKQADCYDMKLKDKSFDSIFMANLIHIVSQPEKVIKEAHRLLKDDGRLIIVSFTADGLSDDEKIKLFERFVKYFGEPPKGGTPFSLNTLVEFVSNHNFQVEDEKYFGNQMGKAIILVAKKINEK